MNKENEEQNEDEINDIRTENELKRIKLALEYGADFSLPEDADLPPEVEGKWLDYMQQFEDAFSKRNKVLLYDFIGNPAFENEATISDDEIDNALKNITEAMNNHQVYLDTLCEVESRVLYKFITEELFEEETDDIRIEGMKHYFIYEEFHPNHEYDVTNQCTDFIKTLLNKEKEMDYDYLGLATEVETTNGILLQANVAKKINTFRAAFSNFDLNDFTIKALHINEEKDKAELYYQIDYISYIDDSTETIQITDKGSFKLITENGYWSINNIVLPGMPL